MFISNSAHYEKVKNERKRLGLDTKGIRQIDIENSLYLNKYIIDTTTGKTYLVERDYKEYCYCGFGWFKIMLLNCNGSHRTIWYENINNDDEIIISSIAKCRKDFNL